MNLWRWSPQPLGLARLKAIAIDIRNGKEVDTASNGFTQMLKWLPRGSHLPSWAKRDLRTLYEYAKQKGLQPLEETLFEIRFGFELEDDWAKNDDPDDIDTLWTLLKDLPDTNVEGNTKIHELLLDEGEGGGWYDPSSNDIAIGSQELSNRERFEDVVRHEVGHAVHEDRDAVVNAWLAQRFGWRIFDRTEADIDAWVGMMGGWGGLSQNERRDVRTALRKVLGSGSKWGPAGSPQLPAGHAWYKPDFGPRLAYEKSGASWFNNHQSWYRHGGKAFFLNYWYAALMVVDAAALDLVAKMPDPYAAMSHYEFFAELYALYYDLDDPQRPHIPGDVAQWLDANIGAPQRNAPMRPAGPPPAKKDFETVTRPKKG